MPRAFAPTQEFYASAQATVVAACEDDLAKLEERLQVALLVLNDVCMQWGTAPAAVCSLSPLGRTAWRVQTLLLSTRG